MQKRLDGKVAIVTGSGSRTDGLGNGRAVARLFAREGANVVINDLNQEAAQKTLEKIESEGGAGSICLADLSKAEEAEKLVTHAKKIYGRLDILHNNVGIEGPGTVVDTEESMWKRVLDINLKTTMLTSKFAIPLMASQRSGAIINTSSISAVRPRGLTPYSAAKGAIISLSKAMAVDHAADGIRVNCILPGPVFTPQAGAESMSDKRREQRRKASPLGLEGTAWDIAYAALYLASDEARWVTGLAVPIDGGVSITSAAR